MCKCTHTRHRDRLQLTTKRNHHTERQIQQDTVGVAPGCAQCGSSACETDNRPDGDINFSVFEVDSLQEQENWKEQMLIL